MLLFTLFSFAAMILNMGIMSILFQGKTTILVMLLNVTALYLTTIYKLCGTQIDEVLFLVAYYFVCVFIITVYSVICNNLVNKNIQEIAKAIKLSEEIKQVKSSTQEIQEILQSLEEAIVVIKNGAISFSNDIF